MILYLTFAASFLVCVAVHHISRKIYNRAELRNKQVCEEKIASLENHARLLHEFAYDAEKIFGGSGNKERFDRNFESLNRQGSSDTIILIHNYITYGEFGEAEKLLKDLRSEIDELTNKMKNKMFEAV